MQCGVVQIPVQEGRGELYPADIGRVVWRRALPFVLDQGMVQVLEVQVSEVTGFKRLPLLKRGDLFRFQAVSLTNPERKPFQNASPPSQKGKRFRFLKKVPCLILDCALGSRPAHKVLQHTVAGVHVHSMSFV